MKRKISPPTAYEQHIQGLMRESACACCGQRPMMELHHATDTGRQISQRHVIPLCMWCHRGVQVDGYGELWHLGTLGPSIERHHKRWVAKYGTERQVAERLWREYEEKAGEIVGGS